VRGCPRRELRTDPEHINRWDEDLYYSIEDNFVWLGRICLVGTPDNHNHGHCQIVRLLVIVIDPSRFFDYIIVKSRCSVRET